MNPMLLWGLVLIGYSVLMLLFYSLITVACDDDCETPHELSFPRLSVEIRPDDLRDAIEEEPQAAVDVHPFAPDAFCTEARHDVA